MKLVFDCLFYQRLGNLSTSVAHISGIADMK